MPSLSARLSRGALVLVLVLGVVGATPGVSGAQDASDTLVARCDLPVVDLFNPLPGDVLPPGEYVISGVAIDPMAEEGTSGIDDVSVYLGNRDLGGTELGSVIPTGGQRLADFSMSITLPISELGKNDQLQAIAHSALSGKETEVRLPVVVGRNPSPGGQRPGAADSVNTNPGVLPDSCAPSDIGSIQLDPTATLTAGQQVQPPHPVVASPSTLFATVVGSVSSCQNGVEQPLTQATVQVQGTSATGQSNQDGAFSIGGIPAPGTYTVTVSDSGNTATRQYVPVAPGETIDIGVLQLGADLSLGCGDEVSAP
jgi:hypothetical protein